MTTTYDKGDLVRAAAAFTTTAGAATDPSAVFAKYTTPAGTVTTLTYGVDAALVKDSTGNYHVDIDASSVGTWTYRFYSTGTGQAAAEGEFFVKSAY